MAPNLKHLSIQCAPQKMFHASNDISDKAQSRRSTPQTTQAQLNVSRRWNAIPEQQNMFHWRHMCTYIYIYIHISLYMWAYIHIFPREANRSNNHGKQCELQKELIQVIVQSFRSIDYFHAWSLKRRIARFIMNVDLTHTVIPSLGYRSTKSRATIAWHG